MGIPAVSVVIPAFNCERFIAAAIESVLAQDFTDFELIIVDDGATDRTLEICRTYAGPRIRIHSQPNRGLAGARNAGIRLARGRYIAFLDADDLWLPDKLSRHVAHLESCPDVGVSYSHSEFIDAAGRPLGLYQTVGRSPTATALCVTRNPIGNGSNAVIRAEVFDSGHANCAGAKVKHFLFDEELRQAEDMELWIRIATQSRWRFDCIALPLTRYRMNAEGLSGNIRAQKGFHFLALVKIHEYAPEIVEQFRTANIAYLYWYLARILIAQRSPALALRHCRAAMDYAPSSLGAAEILIWSAAILQRALPGPVYAKFESAAFAAFGKGQLLRMWWRRRAASDLFRR